VATEQTVLDEEQKKILLEKLRNDPVVRQRIFERALARLKEADRG